MQIPFIGGAYTERSTNLNAQRCVNLFVTVDNKEAKNVLALYGTPGLIPFSSVVDEGSDTVCRGCYVFKDLMYVVIGSDIFAVTTEGVATRVGTLTTSSGKVYFADNGLEMLIVDGTDEGKYVDSTDNLLYSVKTRRGSSAVVDSLEITTAGDTHLAGTLYALGGDGTGFAGSYSVDDTGAINAVQIDDEGEGYTEAPEIIVNDPRGIFSLTITAAGTGYVAGTLSATGGGGSEFAGTYTVDEDGAIDSVTITNPGYDYAYVPTIVIEENEEDEDYTGGSEGEITCTVSGMGTGAVVTASLPEIAFPAASSVTFQDGYFIVTETDTGAIHISSLYDVRLWAALDFASAEASPDAALVVSSAMRDLWIVGEKTVEVFYNSGDNDFPFQRVTGAILDIGTIAPASVVNINGVLYWLNDDKRVVRNSGYQYEIVSTSHIDYQIASYEDVSDATGYTFTVIGHVFYVLVFPSAMKTWLYDTTTGYWSEWESYYNKDDFIPWSRHRGNCCCKFDGKYIVGDYENGKLYKLDIDTYTDNSQALRRLRTGQIISKDRDLLIWNRVEIEFEAGVGLATGQGSEPTACLDWSDDGGHTWSNKHFTSMGLIGQYGVRSVWRRLGSSRNRILRLSISDPVKVVIIGAYADIEGTVV